jgi:hypothetical protein
VIWSNIALRAIIVALFAYYGFKANSTSQLTA